MLRVLAAAIVFTAPPRPDAPAAAQPAASPPDQARLLATIRSLPAKRSPGPTPEHIDGLRRAEEILAASVKDLGFEARLAPVHWGRRDEPAREWHNIEFEIRGKEKPSEVIYVGAHFDAVPASPGADDDASGVAALLEIARTLRDRPLKRTVRFVLFNLEEVGLVGSSQYAPGVAERVAAGEETVVGMLSLEMLGYYSDEAGSQTNPFEAVKALKVPPAGNFLALGTILSHRPFVRLLEQEMLRAEPTFPPVVFDFLPFAPPDLLRSDHAPFLNHGMPAVIVTDTANFRNRNYHKPSDTPETLDLARLAQAARALAGGIGAIAGTVGSEDARLAQPPASIGPAGGNEPRPGPGSR